MKRYVLSAAAAFVVAIVATGGALAEPGPGRGHSLIPRVAPHPRTWLAALIKFPHKPTPPHKANPKPAHEAKPKPAHEAKPKPAHKAKPVPKPAPKAKTPKRRPRPQPQVKTTTLSLYEHSARPRILRAQGCSAARRHETGVVVLDFGKPAYHHGGYGTLLFSGRFAPNHEITSALVGYAHGYVSCLPQGSTASIEVARGTSNYHPSLPSAYAAGVRWGRETNRLQLMLERKGLAAHVEAAAADDAEPAWDPAFRQTREFFHGFSAAIHGHTLYDYGSLDGGVGAIWSARQAWYVAGGLPNTKALPEIYNSAMAQEWADLARIAHGRYDRGVRFAGVMTQGTPSCDCGLRPSAAHQALEDALGAQGIGHVSLPDGGTNIVG